MKWKQIIIKLFIIKIIRLEWNINFYKSLFIIYGSWFLEVIREVLDVFLQILIF